MESQTNSHETPDITELGLRTHAITELMKLNHEIGEFDQMIIDLKRDINIYIQRELMNIRMDN